MIKPDRECLRERILELVEEMGRTSRFSDYSLARSDFSLLLKIKSIIPGWFTTAKDAWEYAGLTREDLVQAFDDACGRS